MTDSIETQVREIIAGTFDVPAQEISRETVAADVDGWDSLGHVTLIMLLERQLGVTLGEDDTGELTDVGALIDKVSGLLRSGSDG